DESPSTGGSVPSLDSNAPENEDTKEVKEILIKNVTNATLETPAKSETKKEEDAGNHLKVVGKIDLDSLNRGKPKKKEEEIANPEKISQPEKVEEKKEEPKIVAEEPKKEEPKVEAPEVEMPKIEQPVAEVPKVEIPKVEQPKKEESKPVPVK